MDLKDMILVMENYKGTERNMLMTLEDYKKFVAIDDMSELADQMLLLGRTLAEGFTEYYRAANVTVFAKFCRDDVELGRFLQCDRQAVDAEFVIELDGEESKLFKEMFAELLK